MEVRYYPTTPTLEAAKEWEREIREDRYWVKYCGTGDKGNQAAKILEDLENDKALMAEYLKEKKHKDKPEEIPSCEMPQSQSGVTDRQPNSGGEARMIPPDIFQFGDQKVNRLSSLQWNYLGILCKNGRLDAVPIQDIIGELYKIDPKKEQEIKAQRDPLKELRARVRKKLPRSGVGIDIGWTNKHHQLLPILKPI
jgi:hypothetical protein